MGREGHEHGCLPLEVLNKAAEKMGLPSSLTGKELREKMNEELKLKVPGERTFLEALPLPLPEKAALAKEYLRPPAPKSWISDPDMWLDSNNISDVMNQYEVARTKDGKICKNNQ
jgi:hypothetical protein